MPVDFRVEVDGIRVVDGRSVHGLDGTHEARVERIIQRTLNAPEQKSHQVTISLGEISLIGGNREKLGGIDGVASRLQGRDHLIKCLAQVVLDLLGILHFDPPSVSEATSPSPTRGQS